jgi:hypothetical protein
MDYRGKYYLVFQRPTSSKWMWSIDLDPKTIESGEAASREAAIRAAEIRIDESLKPKKLKLSGIVIKFRK